MRYRSIPLVVAALSLATLSAAAQSRTAVAPSPGRPGLFTPGDVPWQPGPPSLRPGAHMAVLEGDPRQAGVFTMRLELPDGFVVAPHWHSQVEHVTVIAGVLHFGMGERFDRRATRPMPAGAFGYWPIGMRHFAWAEGVTILQLHGRGPWTVTYVNRADDPRTVERRNDQETSR